MNSCENVNLYFNEIPVLSVIINKRERKISVEYGRNKLAIPLKILEYDWMIFIVDDVIFIDSAKYYLNANIACNSVSGSLKTNFLINADIYSEFDSLIQLRKSDETDSKISVVITNFKRYDKLSRCIDSVILNGLKNIVVSCSALEYDGICVLKNILKKYPFIKVIYTKNDEGNNANWLVGVENAETDFVIVLHDDDFLSPKFAKYKGIIEAKLGKEINHVYWAAQMYDYDNNQFGKVVYNNHGHDRRLDYYSAQQIMNVYGNKMKSLYPISPVVQILHKQTAIDTLRECQNNFTKDIFFFPRKTMLIGNDIMLSLRNMEYCISKNTAVLYIPDVLTFFGKWSESVTVMSKTDRSKKMLKGYNATRDYFVKNRKIK